MPDFPRPARAVLLVALASTTLPSLAHADTGIMVAYDAASGTVTRSVAVETADLPLSSADGRAALDRRIMIAARQACGYEGMNGLRQPADFKRCLSKARTDAMNAAALRN
ncbi:MULTISPECIES: UrcA family protein [Sphingobium]|uniref:UrcA family protein n=1 Tax=Sphingobium chungbukense TaxID=56193 RepID=A0A0M3AJ43_9SPHN|nr:MULTISPECIES: UrcA family protein [Sphingobium]KKW90112.1 hypothetical protein YP76_21965 [Sphingobium chungbukense]PJG49378.1 UrcA family protein [Sphingobium sp. LB126]